MSLNTQSRFIHIFPSSWNFLSSAANYILILILILTSLHTQQDDKKRRNVFWFNISNTGQMVNHRQPPFHHVPMHSLSHHPSLLLSINSFLNSSSFLFFLKIILIWNYDDDLWGWTETWLRYTSCNFCLKSLLVLNLEINAPYGCWIFFL